MKNLKNPLLSVDAMHRGTRWTEEQRRIVYDMYPTSASLREIAGKASMTEAQVQRLASYMHRKRPTASNKNH